MVRVEDAVVMSETFINLKNCKKMKENMMTMSMTFMFLGSFPSGLSAECPLWDFLFLPPPPVCPFPVYPNMCFCGGGFTWRSVDMNVLLFEHI